MDRGGVAPAAHFRHRIAVAKHPSDARQRLEMIGAGAFRRQQQKHQVNRLVVQCFEIDWLSPAVRRPP